MSGIMQAITMFVAKAVIATLTKAAVTTVDSTNGASGAATYTSTAFTPVTSDLLIALETICSTAAITGMTNTTTGLAGALAYTLINSQVDSSTFVKAYAFVANAGATASSQTTAAACAGLASTHPNGGSICVIRVTGCPHTGSSAIKQSAVNSGGAGTTPSVTMGSAVLTGNPVLLIVSNSSSPAGITQPSSWTKFDDVGFTLPTTGTHIAGITNGFTGTTITCGSTSATVWTAVAIEISMT